MIDENGLMEMLDSVESSSSTHMIERVASILRYLAANNHVGHRLSNLADDSGLPKSTVHRILASLIREGLVVQRSGDRRYLLGPMLFELGLSATPERLEIQHNARVRLAQLARQTSSIAKLFFRSGDEFVCSVRVGDVPLHAKDHVLYPGVRRPLCMAAGGVAILMALPRQEAFGILRRNLASLTRYESVTSNDVLRMVRHSIRKGLGVNAEHIAPGVNAVGLALCNTNGEPFGAISLAGPAGTFELDRLEEYRCLLEEIAPQLWARPALVRPIRYGAFDRSLIAA